MLFVDDLSPACLWTLCYSVLALSLLSPPQELHAVGLTLESLLAGWLGSERSDFVRFHLRRTCLNWLAHWCLPLVYIAGLLVWDLAFCLRLGVWFSVASVLSCLAALRALLYVTVWQLHNWHRHPAVRTLLVYNDNWQLPATDISRQFSSVDKFVCDIGIRERVVITSSWLLHTSTYHLHLLRSEDIGQLQLLASSELHEQLHDHRHQLVACRLQSVRVDVPSFLLNVTADHLPELRSRLGQRVANIRSVVVRQTLTERFVDEFCRVVEDNLPVYWPASDLESCIGCDQHTSNVRILRQCVGIAASTGGGGDGDVRDRPACGDCRCRPMWCISCFAKWFASRQDERFPDTWLSRTCPCPTCRTTFCLLDVRRIVSG